MKGSDHQCSLEAAQFRTLVNNIRSLEKALGTPHKSLQDSELPCYQKLGKSLVFSRDLPKGHQLCSEDFNVKVAVPKGIVGSNFDKIIGRVLAKKVKEEESVHMKDLV